MAPLVVGWRTLGWVQRLWFLAVFLGSLGYLVAIPPFQSNDEPSHWQRAWSTASGHLTCGMIPAVVGDTVGAADYFGVHDRRQKFRFASWDAMRLLPGANRTSQSHGNACVYIPVAYVLPAAAMTPFARPFAARGGAGMFGAFYAARAANWLLMSCAVLLFLLLAPQLRNLTLVLYSLPMTMQQTISINQESTIFLCLFVLLLLWFRKPSRATMIGLLVVIASLSAMKSIYLVLLILWACALVRWRRNGDVTRRAFVVVAGLATVPIIVQALWSHYVVAVSASDYLPDWGVSPSGQVAYLEQHPLRLVTMMLRGHLDLFGRGHMTGGWITVLGVLGWADFEIGNRAYLLLVVACVLAVVADFGARVPSSGSNESPMASPWLHFVIPIFSVYLIIPAIILAMYMVFSKVGADSALGVQGRYLALPYFAMTALAVDWLRRRFGNSAVTDHIRVIRPWLSLACAACCGIADHDGFRAILEKYYST